MALELVKIDTAKNVEVCIKCYLYINTIISSWGEIDLSSPTMQSFSQTQMNTSIVTSLPWENLLLEENQ